MLKCEFFTTCPRHRDQKKAEVRAFDAWLLQLHDPLPCGRHAGVSPGSPAFEFPAPDHPMQATYFCTDCCCRPICGHCTTSHVGHRLIQVRWGCMWRKLVWDVWETTHCWQRSRLGTCCVLIVQSGPESTTSR
jgi:hypothetical protein